MTMPYRQIGEAIAAIETYTGRYCCSVLNGQGQEILFFRSEDILPCSESLSRAKALTSHAFRLDTRTLLALPETTAAIRDPRFCFLAGGVFFQDEESERLIIGLSSDQPDIDHVAALAALKAFTSSDKTS